MNEGYISQTWVKSYLLEYVQYILQTRNLEQLKGDHLVAFFVTSQDVFDTPYRRAFKTLILIFQNFR